jgi:hypothetical protein
MAKAYHTLYRLVGLDKHLGLFEVPDGIDAQEAFDSAFELFGDDVELSDVVEHLEDKWGIQRVHMEHISEVFTNKL